MESSIKPENKVKQVKAQEHPNFRTIIVGGLYGLLNATEVAGGLAELHPVYAIKTLP